MAVAHAFLESVRRHWLVVAGSGLLLTALGALALLTVLDSDRGVERVDQGKGDHKDATGSGASASKPEGVVGPNCVG